MPSWDHEGIVELFRSDPRPAAELLQGLLGVELPEFVTARVESGELTQRRDSRQIRIGSPRGRPRVGPRPLLVRGRVEGRAAEKAADVLDILDARGLAVSDAQRDRIISCNDLEVLTRWHRRAITAESTDELFG